MHFSEAVNFEITDIQGKILLQSKKAVKNVDVSNLKAGIYFVKIGDFTNLFVKE